MKEKGRGTANRRTVLKLLGTGVVASGASTGVANAEEHTMDAEIEGPLQAVGGDGTVDVMGITVDASGASITSPTTAIQFSQLEGEKFPGRDLVGFIGGTATAVGTTADTGGTVVADSLFVEPAENVIVGPVTDNTVTKEGDETNESAINDGSFKVQGTKIRTAQDSRLPFHAVMEGTDFKVDVSTIPEGSLAEVEGYYGNDGVLYAHTLGATEGETEGKGSLTITRAECDPDDDGPDELAVRGNTSAPDGTVSVYDHHTDELLGTTQVGTSDDGTGTFNLDAEIDTCPSVVRAENTDGSQDIANVD